MKEKQLIEIIKNTLNSEYIGDDCAYLKDLGIVVTQDSLVEDVHFSRVFMSPFQLGYKSVMVNISDVCASGADPKYLTISLSLPSNIEPNFVKEFYEGCKSACGNVKIVGGDITGSDKIFISLTAIGKTEGRKISSRSNAKAGQKIIVSGNHGSSGAGLRILLNNFTHNNDLSKPNDTSDTHKKLIETHLMPKAQCEFSKQISTQIKENYSMMDSSDGLMDALSTIANDSGVILSVDFDKIPYESDLKKILKISQQAHYDDGLRDLIFFGGEDYEIIATIPDELLNYLSDYTIIGEVKAANSEIGVEVKYSDKTEFYTKKDVEEKLYNHFKE